MAEHNGLHSAKRRRLSVLQGQTHDYTADVQGPQFAEVVGGEIGTSEGSNITISSKFAGQTITPFLTQHIPEQYAPLGGPGRGAGAATGSPNTKYCYRHRPDIKCRRQANEPSMDQLQHVRSVFPRNIRFGGLTLSAGA